MATNKRGIDLLQDPSLNKSTAFTEAEKQMLGVVGLVPDVTETEDLQLSRVMMQLGHKSTDLERYIVQNAIVQVSIKGMPATAVMTTNISRFVVDFITLLSERDRDLAAKAGARAKHTVAAIVGFSVGCGLGAGCEILMGLWALALPTGLAFLALVIVLASSRAASASPDIRHKAEQHFSS